MRRIPSSPVRHRGHPVPSLLAALALAAALHAHDTAGAETPGLVLNEVFYDPVGADEGREFIELYLSAAESLDLGRVTIERGNGSRPGDWRRVWQGAAGESLAPESHYVVGGELVAPPPNAQAALSLQNGPDACRLLLDGVVVDVLGWGDLETDEFFAGSPARDVPAGTSLGRVPDGHDTGRNDLDFHPQPAPNPGAPNRRPSPFKLKSPRHRSDAGSSPRLEVEWMVAADEGYQSAAVEVSVAACSLAGVAAVARTTLIDGEASGTLVLGPLHEGIVDLCLTCAAIAPAGEAPPADTIRVAARAGPGPLRVNEFLFRPHPGEPEWVEVVNASPDTIDAARFAFADGRGEPVGLDGAPLLPPDGLLVLAEEVLPAGVPALVLGARWPLLNDTGAPFADRVRLLDEEGRTSDDVAYAGDWAPAGASVERLSARMPSADRAAWSVAPTEPTPGRRNGAARELADIRGFLQIDPAVIPARTPGPVLVQFASPLGRGALTIHSSDGRLIRRFAGDALLGRRWLTWDGRDDDGAALPPGLYLVTLAAEAAGAGPGDGPPGGAGAVGEAGASEPDGYRVVRATLVVSP